MAWFFYGGYVHNVHVHVHVSGFTIYNRILLKLMYMYMMYNEGCLLCIQISYQQYPPHILLRTRINLVLACSFIIIICIKVDELFVNNYFLRISICVCVFNFILDIFPEIKGMLMY